MVATKKETSEWPKEVTSSETEISHTAGNVNYSNFTGRRFICRMRSDRKHIDKLRLVCAGAG